ncbi:hypothetical protein ACEPAH_5161 [Sanghuangporus vaninii]
MSLYTPVFPPTDPPASRTSSSSSLSSVELQKQQRGLSYSSRLAQWHLAIASLPYELCPPSSPLSPNSQARSANLQSEIEKAVREGRNITDFCKLRSTKLGYATKRPAYNSLEQGDGIPWILAETEEEWLEWEREVAQRRPQQKRKERANSSPPPITQSQNAHDKVVSWKAGLLPLSVSPVTAPSAPSASTGRSSLGFPVVKRSTMVKGNKLKTNKPAIQITSAPRLDFEAQTDGDDSLALRVDARAINSAHMDTGGAEHGGSPLESRHSPPSEGEAGSFAAKDQENVNPEIQEYPVSNQPCNNDQRLICLQAFPPPSFPPDLITSTQKDVLGSVQSMRRSSPLPPTIAIEIQEDGDALDVIIKEDNLESQVERPPVVPAVSNELTIETRNRRAPQATPPSPPYSSETSQQPMEQREAPSHTDLSAKPQPLEEENARPLTPPTETVNIAHVSNEIEARISPRTPERTPQKKSGKSESTNMLGGVGGTDTRNTGMEMNGHMTPDTSINGASVTRGMFFPRTPERQTRLLTDPLTTSRKSRPRPRPPSRKHSVQKMELDRDGAVSDADDGPDPSPAKSDRSYFSSPASGSSSDSELCRGSMLFVPGSPTLPLGFTQNPNRFAPLAQSTQLTSRGPPGSPTPLHSRCKSQSQSQKGIYDSQFDVDTRVDQLSNFMRQDVDLDAWVHATDTDGEADGEDEDEDAHDVFAVEELTKTQPLSFGSS